jgi:hypothetical protein
LAFQVPNIMSYICCLRHSKRSETKSEVQCNRLLFLYGKEQLVLRLTPMLEDHPLLAVPELLIHYIHSYPSISRCCHVVVIRGPCK